MKQLLITIMVLLTAGMAAQQANTTNAPALSAKAIEAYGIKSEQKVREFYDYMQLLSDPSINEEMKDHTMREALRLFRNEHVDTYNLFDPRGGEITIYKLLKNARSAGYKCNYEIRNFKSAGRDMSPALQVWELSYDLVTNDTSLHKIKQLFYIVSEDKKFGTTTKKVWNNYLGELRFTSWKAMVND